VARLRADLDALRAALAEEVTTRRVVVIDPAGGERIRLAAAADAEAAVTVCDPDGHARATLAASGPEGHLRIRARAVSEPDDEPTLVDLFALDAEDAEDHPYVGLELIDRGDSVAGFSHYRSPRPHPWWSHPDDHGR